MLYPAKQNQIGTTINKSHKLLLTIKMWFPFLRYTYNVAVTLTSHDELHIRKFVQNLKY